MSPRTTVAPRFVATRHPGGVLRREFMEPYGLTAYALAQKIGVDRARIENLVRGKRSVSADTAARLAWLFGTTPQFWLNLQAAYDLAQMDPRALDAIEPLATAG